MNKTVATIRYKQVEKLIDKTCYEFQAYYKGDIEEIKSEARVHFMHALHTYDSSKGTKFSTWVRYKVWYGLLRTKQIQTRKAAQLKKQPFHERDLVARSHFDVDALLADLSNDARLLVQLALDPPMQTAHFHKLLLRPQSVRKIIRETVEAAGWTAEQITAAFQEVRRVLFEDYKTPTACPQWKSIEGINKVITQELD